MDECENLVIDLEEEYEKLAIEQQINDNDAEVTELTSQDEGEDNMGQAESKKHAKKQNASGVETKGTAMSFGFRKKLNTTPKKLRRFIEGDNKKKQDKCNNIGGKTSGDESDGGRAATEVRQSAEYAQDDNGNAEPMPKIQFEKVGAAAVGSKSAQRSAASQGVPTEDMSTGANRPGAGNRFGFRGGHIVRPASTGITPRCQSDMNSENMENNNCNVGESTPQRGLVSSLKRRSKSAHAGRTPATNQSEQEGCNANAAAAPKIAQPKSITFNLKQNSTIEYQRQQFFQQPTGNAGGRAAGFGNAWEQQQQQQQQYNSNTGIHTNAIVRPTPRAPPATYSKFTLHTVSLPKPEFPVAISLNASTPTTPGSTYTPSPMTAVAAEAATSATGTRAKHQLTYTAQHPLTVAQSQHMDLKSAKQMANNTRRGFTGSREISADSGIASMDMAMDSSSSSAGGGGNMSARRSSPKRSRSRPRNLQMVMSGRHKFEVRELDDPLSSESSSMVETLALPKLPAEHQTVPLPLSGLVRSNTVLSRESYERRHDETKPLEIGKPLSLATAARQEIQRHSSEESESLDEEKLFLDRSASEKHAKLQQQFHDINTCSSKTSSPGSSIMSSWCNAGEALATKDCSSLSISSSEDNQKVLDKLKDERRALDLQLELLDEDISALNTDMQISTISSITEAAPMMEDNKSAPQQQQLSAKTEPVGNSKPVRPKSLCNTELNETKFAEMALEGSTYLLDDETSPTDSLVSSTESEEVGDKQKKHKMNEELQEKDIDEISPELEMCSPISPGTPTHASHSLSLSDCGNLIDDEIADQPALLFNSDTHEGMESVASRKETTDTPTLMESASMRSLKSQSKVRSALQQAMELSLRTPLSLRKAVMERAESLDTLSPCESICSEDLMMDFDMNSSIDSIDRSLSIRSRSGSDLNKIGETELFSELDRKGSDVMKELSTILRVHSLRKIEKESVIAHLPARATRLLNRSRLQQQQQCPLTNTVAAADSDSSRSAHSVRRSTAGSRASTASNTASRSTLPRHQQLQQHRDSHSSSDDLMLYDKSFRNAMIQDVLQFKKQLLRLRRILQETETLNPFENDNGQLFASCGLDSKLLDDMDLASLTSSTTDDPMLELADLRRQVVYLQSQVDDRERTIRTQRHLIDKLEADKATNPMARIEASKECINMATQTERTRPLAIGSESLSRSKPEYTSYTTHFPAVCSDSTTIIQHHQQQPGNNRAANQTRRHTIISTTLTNYNQQLAAQAPRRASIAWEQQTATSPPTPPPPSCYKPVKITLIGEPLQQCSNSNGQQQQHNGQRHATERQQQQPQMLHVRQQQQQQQQLKQQEPPLLNGQNSRQQLGRHEALEARHLLNGVKHSYAQLDKHAINSHQHPHQHQQQQQQKHHHTYYQAAAHANGHLNPTVTIV